MARTGKFSSSCTLVAVLLLVTVTMGQTFSECLKIDKDKLIGVKQGRFIQNYDEILEFSSGAMRAYAFTTCFNEYDRLISLNFTVREQATDKNLTLQAVGPIEKGMNCKNLKIGDFSTLIDKIDVYWGENTGIYAIRANVGARGETFGTIPDGVEVNHDELYFSDD